MARSATLTDTGERMVPKLHKGHLIYAEHLLRYQAAQHLVNGKTVLDIACGSGYGAKLLSESAHKVVGVDVAGDAIAYAKKHYAGANIEYLQGSATAIPLADKSVDVVVTFETVEHIKDYKKFIREIKRVLRQDGLLIISTPNDLEFPEGNHFHLHEFTYRELKDLLKPFFTYVDSYFQATWKGVALGSADSFAPTGATSIPLQIYSEPTQHEYLYFYLVCSNRKITEKLKPLAAFGEHYSDRTSLEIQTAYDQKIKAYEELAHDAEELRRRLSLTLVSRLRRLVRLVLRLSHIRK